LLLVALFLVGCVLVMVNFRTIGSSYTLSVIALGLPALALGTVGLLIATRRPNDAIGWIYLSCGLWLSLAIANTGYTGWATVVRPGGFGGTASEWFGNWPWAPLLAVFLTFPFLLFPDGHLLNARWRPVAWGAGVVTVIWTLSVAFSSTQYTGFVSWDGTCDGEKMTGVETNGATWPTAGEKDASGPGEVTQSLRSLWYYHQDVLTFHRYFLNCAQHDYGSKPSGWLLVNRPVGADAQLGIQPGEQGCDAAPGSDCLRQVLIIGNPVLWWGCALALLASIVLWVGTRDWRYGVAVVGTLSTWLPWLMYDDRPIFIFYAILSLPFLVLAATLVLGRLIGGTLQPSPRRTLGVVVAGSFFVLVLVNFAWFWPIWTDGLLTHAEWMERIWFKRWI
jgi:hypothetical protein